MISLKKMAKRTLAIVLVLLIVLMWIAGRDATIGDYVFGCRKFTHFTGTGFCKMIVWESDMAKLVLDTSASKPVCLYVTIDPIAATGIMVSKAAVMRRLANMCDDDVGYNFVTFQFDIKSMSIVSALERAMQLQDASNGIAMAPVSISEPLMDLGRVVMFKQTYCS
jgi:hypothetical protein